MKDYCSFVPDGKANFACKNHDVDYAMIRIDRANVDYVFLDNMLYAGVWKPKAYLYYWGVRIFGRLFI